MSVFAFYLFAISAITGGLFTVVSRQPVKSRRMVCFGVAGGAGQTSCISFSLKISM